jgi:hypothetical protein
VKSCREEFTGEVRGGRLRTGWRYLGFTAVA